MPLTSAQILHFLKSVHPYDALPEADQEDLAGQIGVWEKASGEGIYQLGDDLPGLFLIYEGAAEIRDKNNAMISRLGIRNSFGERGLLLDGRAVTSAYSAEPTILLVFSPEIIAGLIAKYQPVARFFDRTQKPRSRENDLTAIPIETFMASNPLTCRPEDTVKQAAQQMRDARVSSLCVTDDGRLIGIITVRDLSFKVLASELPAETLVEAVMTANPITLGPAAIGSDLLHLMMERRIGHVPIVEGGHLVGMVTQTDLTRFQAISSAELVSQIATAKDAEEIAQATARIPNLLVQLVAGGSRHEIVTRLITDIADAATRRLLSLARKKAWPTAGALSMACLWLSGAPGADRRQ